MSALILAQVAVGNTALAALARAVLASADPPMNESETYLLDEAMELLLELTPARP
ncbi:hypothetical protein M2163_002150 [Streptomyces sp. SAI-135]|nr:MULTISPECIES: hypothetical protein [unclassified Streptomyces]MDH6520867.1 hypothetical protein [Streptomyces sp. SAI-090]MDH6572169.1 hypothetical protein [Streptomyces sp. SAI-117]MDH6582872.1 hypothetical protein [Streptomyces sp. SAI-133]MDH6615042.1 hypothetical protein [Streptomyces sp. SAI-135]